jgi:hypothetical protein
MLSRSGYVTRDNPEIKKELTVRPAVNAIGITSPSFKVFRCDQKGNMCVPRYFGAERLGAPKDHRPEPSSAHIEFTGQLRKETCQDQALSKFFETPSGGVLSLPCGWGKTSTALAIAARLKLRTMIIVHKEFLANQWKERIQQFCPGSTIGIVQCDQCETDNDFVIAMIQTLCTREHPKGTFDSIGFLIVDEAHHIGAPAFSQALFRFCPKYTLGLSATPERKDGLTRLLFWFLGPLFFKVERTGQNHVKVNKVPFDCALFHHGPLKTLVEMISDLVNIPERNQLILDIVQRCTNRKVLILTDRRAHCFWLRDNIQGSGLYIGGMKEQDLEESSRCPVIIGTFSQAHEGLDIPDLDTIILTTPHSDVKQAVGRILRGANDPVIYDMIDHWSVLFSMWTKRLAMYRKSGFDCETTKKCLFS